MDHAERVCAELWVGLNEAVTGEPWGGRLGSERGGGAATGVGERSRGEESSAESSGTRARRDGVEAPRKAHALLVGLTEVDPRRYGGWDGREGCAGCALDVEAMRSILKPLGYSCRRLITHSATAASILGALRGLSRRLEPGDILAFHFSGHGAQLPDPDGEEADRLDETLVAYDREILDDELAAIWPLFREGVRVVMTSDSCNAGTNYRGTKYRGGDAASPPGRGRRGAAIAARQRTLAPRTAPGVVRAQLIHIGACRDGEASVGLEEGGIFTRALVEVWDEGRFAQGYREFSRRIRERVGAEIPEQHVTYSELGKVTDAFRRARPFQVG